MILYLHLNDTIIVIDDINTIKTYAEKSEHISIGTKKNRKTIIL